MRIMFIMAMLCTLSKGCCAQAWSQGPLSVGDRLPDIEWTVVKNYEHASLNTDSFNDRLLILDFWSTFCTACIQGFPKMQKLQEKFGNKLQVVLVNATDDEARIEKYVGMKFLQRFQLPTVFHDSMGIAYFPHRTIPHYVWIYKGEVKAITEGDEVNEKNIQDLFNGKKLSMPQKIMVDKERLLFTSELLPVENTLHYSLLLKGYIPGLGGSNFERKENGKIRGFCFINRPLIEIYKSIARKKMKNFSDQRIILDVVNKKDFIIPENEIEMHNWFRDHSYSYELRVPAQATSGIYELLLDELNRLTGYTVTFKKIKTPSLVLLYDSSIARVSFYPQYYKCKSTAEMAAVINHQKLFDLPVIDGTGFRYIEVRVPEKGITKEELIQVLKEQGYKLREEERELEMMIIREKGVGSLPAAGR